MKTNGTTPIPQGYKATPLGIIPQEWEIESLNQVCDFLDSQRIPIKDSDRTKISGIYPYYGASGIIDYVNNYIFNDDLILLAEDGANIINRSTPIAFLVQGKIWVNNHAHVLKAKPSFDRYYLCAYLESIKYDKYNTGTAQPKLNREVCEKIPVLAPLLAEQQKIAEILGTWDKAIEKQSQLIRKLELRKKGLMQQLLTTKRRLPGFSDPWKKVRLGEISKIGTGNKNNEDKVVNGKYPFFVRSSNVERINSYSYDGEAILIPGEGKIGEIIHYVNGKFDYHQRVYKISNFSNCLGKYLYYYLMCFFGKQATNNSVKACVDSLRLSTFTNMKILYPSFEEQTAITQVLTAADREIELAQQKFELLRQQKRGLMQQLLTGKKRVKF